MSHALTDEEYDEQKRRLDELIEQWRAPLGLGWWRIEFVWERESYGGHRELDEGRFDTRYADTTVLWQYRLAIMRWFLPEVAALDDDQLKEAFFHEAAHIHVAQMKAKPVRKVDEEHCVTGIAKALGWMYDAGYEAAQDEAGHIARPEEEGDGAAWTDDG